MRSQKGSETGGARRSQGPRRSHEEPGSPGGDSRSEEELGKAQGEPGSPGGPGSRRRCQAPRLPFRGGARGFPLKESQEEPCAMAHLYLKEGLLASL